jgi:hypothetical protein
VVAQPERAGGAQLAKPISSDAQLPRGCFAVYPFAAVGLPRLAIVLTSKRHELAPIESLIGEL